LRYIAALLSLVMLLQFNLLIAPAFAEVVSVTASSDSSTGSISGQFAVTKVGALIAADALAILSGTEIKIENHSNNNSPAKNPTTGNSDSGGTGKNDPKYKSGQHASDNSDAGAKEPLLVGSLVQVTTSSHLIKGCALFTGGKNFRRLNLRACPDRVTTKAGKSYTGKITVTTDKSLTIVGLDGSHDVNYSDISDIHSGRAFFFSIPNYDGPTSKMSLSPTCIHSAQGSTVKKLIIVGLVFTVVAVSVAVPVAVSAHHHHHNNTNNLILANYLQSKQTVPMPIMPTGTTMPTPQQLGASYVATLLNRPVVPTTTRAVTATVNRYAATSTSSVTSGSTFTGGFFSP
jgi:hypothetical protein